MDLIFEDPCKHQSFFVVSDSVRIHVCCAVRYRDLLVSLHLKVAKRLTPGMQLVFQRLVRLNSPIKSRQVHQYIALCLQNRISYQLDPLLYMRVRYL